MTAVPTYKWAFAYDLWGDRVPKIATFELTAASLLKVGTLVSLVSGQIAATTGGTGDKVIGICAQDIDTSPAGADPVKVAVIAPGMVIKGTADATAVSLDGFATLNLDIEDGALDTDDTSGGGLSVLRTEDSGLTVYCVVTTGVII